MHITNFYADGFKLLKDVNINFQKGLNIISGDNGNGKSHVIKAIAFLLTGYTEKKIAKFVSWYGNSFKTGMTFYHDNHKFEISAEYKDEKNSSAKRTLKIDDTHTFTDSQVTSVLSSFIDPTLGQASILSLQWAPNIVTTKPAERRDYLKKIYDADFAKQIKEIDENVKAKEKELDPIEKDIYLYEHKEYKFEEPLPLPYDESTYLVHKAKLSEVLTKIALLDKEEEERKQKLIQIQNLEKQISEDKIKVVSVQKSIEGWEAEKRTIQVKLGELRTSTKIADMQKKVDETDFLSEVKEVDEELRGIIIPRIPSTFDENPIDEKRKELNNLNANVVIIYNSLTAAQNGLCPTCNRPFESHDKEQYEKDLQEAKEKAQACKLTLDELETKKKIYDKQVADKQTLEVQFKMLTQKKEKAEKQAEIDKRNALEKIEYERKAIDASIQNTESSIKQIEGNIENAKEKVTTLEEAIQKNEGDLSQIEVPEQESESRDLYNTTKVTVEKLIASYDEVQANNTLIAQRNEQLTKEQAEDGVKLENLRQQRSTYVQDIDLKKQAKDILRKTFPNYIIASTIETLKVGMNNWVKDVYDSRYEVFIEEDASGISVLYGPKKEDVHFSSGFEHGLMSLAYMSSMNYLTRYNLLILDEPDSYATEDNSEKLFRLVAESKNYEQTLMITHKPNVRKMLQDEYQAKIFEVTLGQVKELV